MIVLDLYSADGHGKKPLERMEIWNIDASNFFIRPPLEDFCDYCYRIIKNPDSIRKHIYDEILYLRSMAVLIPHHYQFQNSWTLVERILGQRNNLTSLNNHWAKTPDDIKSENVDFIMALWPGGDRSEKKKFSKIKIRKSDQGWKYSVVDISSSVYVLAGKKPIRGIIPSGEGDTPWNVCAKVLDQLRDHGCFVLHSPSTPQKLPASLRAELVNA